MARYYPLDVSNAGSCLNNALLDYYGDGVTITSVSADRVDFECPQICDKPIYIRAQKPTSYGTISLRFSFDGVVLESCGTGSGQISTNSKIGQSHLVLSDSFLLIQIVDVGANSYSSTLLIAKASNGRYICVLGSAGAYSQCGGYITDTAEKKAISFMAPYSYSVRTKRKIPLLRSHFADNREVEMNADNSMAYIEGLWLTTEKTTGGVVGTNYFLSHGSVFGATASDVIMPGSFYVELEE